MIKGIIFDFGGVFTHKSSLKEFCKFYSQKNNLNFENMRNLMINNWLKARIQDDSEFFFTELIAFTNNKNIKQELLDFFGFNDDFLKFVKTDLYGKYKLGIISNHIKSWFEPQIEKYGLNNIFDDITTSYNAKSAKPETKIYQQALNNLKLNANECIFVDDRKDNVDAANKLGFNGIFFENLDKLKQKFEKN